MKSFQMLATALVALAFAAAPAMAVNEHGADHANGHATDNGATGNGNGGSSSEAPKGNAYGRACADQSRKHVKGEKGTPFSHCVKAMAQVDKGEVDNPRKACKELSKKHVKGEKGTPFSRCVKAAAQLQND
jgi:hypothetical protein